MTEEKSSTIRAATIGLPRALVQLILAILAFSAAERISSVASAREAEGSPPSAFEEGPFGDFDDEEEYPSPDQLKTILAQVPGQPYEITKRNRGRRPATFISGLFRLTLPWETDKALRLSVWDPDGLRIHLWNGRTGVTLRFHRHFYQTWAAYGTTREASEPHPSTRALWATDGGRYRRVGVGTVEVHYREGNLTLARGDLTLLSVPIPGPPSEIFVEGKGMVRGLAMVRSSLPNEPPRSCPVALHVLEPAELEWVGELPEGVSLNKLPDGRIELRAEPHAKDAQTETTLLGSGLHEVIVELEDPDPGAGVYFADRDGKSLMRLAFFRDRTTGETTFGLLHPSHREIDRSHDVARHVVLFAGRRQWLRVILGAGVLKYWTSGDGVHWSRTAPTVQALEGECRRVGLYTLAYDKPRAIKLRSIEVRRLEAMASLLPDAVRQQVDLLFEGERETFVKAENLDVWEERVAQLQTPDIEDETWWCACSLATLAAGPNLTLGRPLLDGLIRRVLAETWQLDRGLQMLEEAALLSYTADRQVTERLGSHYEQFGRRLARRGEPKPLTAISRAMMRAPLWTDGRLGVFSDHLLRHELFTLIGQDRWPEVARLSRRLTHWNQTQADPPLSRHGAHLTAWASAQASGHVPSDGRNVPVGVPIAWRHPLVERLSKEGYNVLAELDATLQARAFRDACQVISMSAGIETLGLLPDGRDPRLWAPFPAAMASTMRDYPALRETMQREFGPQGRLRVRQAIAAGDVTAVEMAALQFCGTDAARDAAAWLGDRSLSSGRFAEAFEHYQSGLRDASDERRGALLARLRLAGALTGRDVGSPIAFPVEIGGSRLAAKQFERLIEELRRTHQAPHDSPDAAAGAATPSTEAGFLPGRYTTHAWARVNGGRVQRPSAMPDRGLDWSGRQTAVLVTDRQMLVNNQLDQLAFDLATGDLLWAQCRAVESRYQQWPLVRMQPVLARGRVFARQLADEGPELVSLEAVTGRIVWSSNPDGHVASDPLFLGNNLFALTVGYHPGEKLALSLTRFDPDSGHVLRQTLLAEFRDVWRRQLPAQAIVADGRIVATAGGCVLSCDASGRVSWLRRQIWVPRSGDSHSQAPQWFEQAHELPPVRDGRVYATQPGVWAVECLHWDTGQLLWRRAVGGLTRTVGLASGRLILQTPDGLLALDPESGKTLWHYASDDPLEARLCGRPDLILAYHLQKSAESPEQRQFALVWIDAETGRPRERSVLKAPESSGPWLGPLAARGDRQWALVAAADDAKSREVIELKLDTQP